ncbi:hypothetical protein BVC80_9059g80 [Macleaya cordata]|uniref:Uncharacterized protein n=1 Tax=Macleaya cordata TaxID=56857 RepID=A0A200RAL5_MACCD|nr:hypothetical protein BVC80_9059g80 [Macleaya cordata]
MKFISQLIPFLLVILVMTLETSMIVTSTPEDEGSSSGGAAAAMPALLIRLSTRTASCKRHLNCCGDPKLIMAKTSTPAEVEGSQLRSSSHTLWISLSAVR